MHPTAEQLLAEAAKILEASATRDMYAGVLATSIAGQLNAREQVNHYEPASGEGLVSLLELDARYAVRHDAAGFPIVSLVQIDNVKSVKPATRHLRTGEDSSGSPHCSEQRNVVSTMNDSDGADR